jgi:UDP-N-acetylmuramyl pentapeptide phosphotransferase/UDP-N-acetylglucosamine-1-phosphate transferase
MRNPKQNRRRLPPPRVGGTPILIVMFIPAVLVATVIVLAVEAGTSTAVLAAVLAVVIAVTAFGVWGAAMAVRETGRQVTQEQAQQIEGSPTEPKRPLTTQNL